ncbi:S8/S53 family peptidase [Hymenobacter guriensis]|uniref:Uncharacterized protein n=1 Tax=Hymenobacter guriensis TaxID=2793065 RepID=A0ABS0L6C4_9BACT|nr:hypothetical protein [Hymenobacter guriensis]MBG8554939.1 hypothetical protein [Hymenobacter guriensis]
MPTVAFCFRNFSILGFGLMLLGGCSSEDSLTNATTQSRSVTQVAQAPSLEPVTRLQHQYLLLSSTDKLPADLLEQAWLANGTITGTLPEVGLALATSDDPEFQAKASRMPGIKSVIHDFSYQAPKPQATRTGAAYTAVQPSADAHSLMPWAQATKNTNSAAEQTSVTKGQGTLVAVLGRGNRLMPAFKNRVVGSASFVPGEEAQVAPVRQVASTSPEARVLMVKVLGDEGTGSLGWMLQGLYFATTQRANIVSLDLATAVPSHSKYRDDHGTPNDSSDDTWVNDPQEIQTLLVAISKVMNYASQRGVAVTAPARHMTANGNKRLVHIPADLPNVVAITPQTDLAMLNASAPQRQ